MRLDVGSIEIVLYFTYLGSNITSDGEVKDKVKSHIGKAARAFGCLQRSIFKNCHLSVETKRKVYGAAVLSVAGTHIIKTATCCFWDGRRNGLYTLETPFTVAWAPDPYRITSNAKAITLR